MDKKVMALSHEEMLKIARNKNRTLCPHCAPKGACQGTPEKLAERLSVPVEKVNCEIIPDKTAK